MLAGVLLIGGCVLACVPIWGGLGAVITLCIFQTFQLSSYAMSDASILERVSPNVARRVVGVFLTIAGTSAQCLICHWMLHRFARPARNLRACIRTNLFHPRRHDGRRKPGNENDRRIGNCLAAAASQRDIQLRHEAAASKHSRSLLLQYPHAGRHRSRADFTGTDRTPNRRDGPRQIIFDHTPPRVSGEAEITIIPILTGAMISARSDAKCPSP